MLFGLLNTFSLYLIFRVNICWFLVYLCINDRKKFGMTWKIVLRVVVWMNAWMNKQSEWNVEGESEFFTKANVWQCFQVSRKLNFGRENEKLHCHFKNSSEKASEIGAVTSNFARLRQGYVRLREITWGYVQVPQGYVTLREVTWRYERLRKVTSRLREKHEFTWRYAR